MLATKKMSLEEYLQCGSEESLLLNNWVKSVQRNGYYYGFGEAYLSDELVQFANSFPVELSSKLKIIREYLPPVLDLTDEDFKEHIQTALPQWQGRSYYHGSWGTTWRDKKIASRSKVTPIYDLERLIATHFSERKNNVPFMEWVIQLNEYLNSDEECGSFQNYLDSPKTKEVEEMLSKFLVVNHPHTQALLSYANSKNAANFDHRAQKRTRTLLFSQEKDFWVKTIIDGKYKEYKKGYTHQHAEKFVEWVKSEKQEKLKSLAEIQSELMYLLCKKAVDVYDSMADEKYFKVVKASINAPIDLSVAKNNLSELNKLVEHLAKNDFTIKQLTGLLLALTYPKTWLRGNTENGIDLMLQLITSEKGSDYVGFISDIVYEEYPDIPSETEWRKSLSDEIHDLPTEMFLIFTAQPKVKGKRRAVPEYIALHIRPLEL